MERRWYGMGGKLGWMIGEGMVASEWAGDSGE